MSLIRAKNLSLAFGYRPLLAEVEFSVVRGERIALLGRNGEGKSTLLNVIRGAQQADAGGINVALGINIAYLPQEPPAADEQKVSDVIRAGVQYIDAKIAEYTALLKDFDEKNSARLLQLESDIQQADGWSLDGRLNTIMAEFSLSPDTVMRDLSGGWRRRVWLARTVLSNPDVLLLDEPTNHLDINAIDWLEEYLLRFSGASIFVTHDRAFLTRIATRIWELDRGELLDVSGDYSRFLRTREEVQNTEDQVNTRFDKKLAQEEQWIRQGIKARRTRNEGRVQALKTMRQERAARLSQQGKVSFSLNTSTRSGKQVIVAENVSFSYTQESSLITAFSDVIERGEKIALIGANGVGKTTLIKLLLKELTPQQGTVIHGTNISVSYVDQFREQLDWNLSLRDNVSAGSDYIEINGKRCHIASYLQDFLFPPERWQAPTRVLSGGERARLLLAKLFAKPANVLVLDEPTNDLDIETLELLEEKIDEYKGTVLMVSHDRTFIDEIATRSWVFDERAGTIRHVPGGFSDWIAQGGELSDLDRKALLNAEITVEKKEKDRDIIDKNKTNILKVTSVTAASKIKLSYNEQRELESLPSKIDALEEQLKILLASIEHAEFSQKSYTAQAKVYQQMQEAQQILDDSIARWVLLESRNKKQLR